MIMSTTEAAERFIFEDGEVATMALSAIDLLLEGCFDNKIYYPIRPSLMPGIKQILDRAIGRARRRLSED